MVAGHVVGRHVVTGQGGTTSAPGVWAAGNVTDLQAQVAGAAAAGLMAGAHLNADLVAEEVRWAVASWRSAAAGVSGEGGGTAAR